MNCPECGKELKNAIGVLNHWGYQHDGDPPEWVKDEASDIHPHSGVTGDDHPATGNTFSLDNEAIEKIRQSKLGEQNPAKRPEVAEKISDALSKDQESYPSEWTSELKEEIRVRDNRQCQRCHTDETELRRKLDVHHIDGDKQNCQRDNLISLCQSCHLISEYENQLTQIQYELFAWQKENYPSSDVWTDIAGIAEEFGELARVQIDIMVGREPEKFDSNEEAMKDAIGDVLIYLSQLASKHGISVAEAMTEATGEIMDEESHHG